MVSHCLDFQVPEVDWAVLEKQQTSKDIRNTLLLQTKLTALVHPYFKFWWSFTDWWKKFISHSPPGTITLHYSSNFVYIKGLFYLKTIDVITKCLYRNALFSICQQNLVLNISMLNALHDWFLLPIDSLPTCRNADSLISLCSKSRVICSVFKIWSTKPNWYFVWITLDYSISVLGFLYHLQPRIFQSHNQNYDTIAWVNLKS